MEISHLSDKEFKVMDIKCSTYLGEEWKKILRISTELENIKKNQPELNYMITDI